MLKKIRFYSVLTAAFIKKDKRKFAVLAVFALLSLFLLKVLIPAATPKIAEAYQEFKKPTFVEGVVGQAVHPNPLFDESETQKDISKLVFRSLTKVDENGRLVSDLAENYEINDSSSEYIFHLKEDVYWHDGEKFTSDDVVYTVKLAQDQSIQSKLSENFKNVKVEKIDEYTVSFKIPDPFAPFPFTTTVGIIPEHIGLKRYKPIGTGDFKVKSVGSERIVLTNSKLNIVFRFYPSFEDAKHALKLGEIHALGGFSPQDVGEFEKFGGREIYKGNLSFRQAVVFFNTKNTFLKEKNLRQALAYALNKEEIRVLAGGGEAVVSTNQFIRDNWIIDFEERYKYDMKEANKLLREAGFESEDEVWMKDGKELKLVINTADDKELNTIANLIKESWEKIGIPTEIKNTTIETLRDEIIANRQFQVLINFQDIPADPDQYVLWHTTQIQNSNITGISSPKLDKLLEEARKISDQDERAEQYRLFTTLLQDEVPAIFLYYPEYIWIVSDDVRGIDFTEFSIPVDRFSSFNKWEIKNGYQDIAF